MVEKIDQLQLINFEDLKASDYAKALKNEYKNYDVGFSISISLVLSIASALLGMIIVGSLVTTMGPVVFAAVGCAMVAFSAFCIPYNYLRKIGLKQVLQDPEAKYAHQLKQAIDTYNEQAAVFNRHLLVFESGASQMTAEELKRFRSFLGKERRELQKRIGIEYRKDLPVMEMSKVWQKMRELNKVEVQLVLPALKKLPEASANYSEALAELDAEFTGDKD